MEKKLKKFIYAYIYTDTKKVYIYWKSLYMYTYIYESLCYTPETNIKL